MADTQNPTPQTDPLTSGANFSFESTRTAAMAMAAHIGQMAALQRLNSGLPGQGSVVGGYAPTAPNPTPLPAPIPQGGMPDTHSQYENPGQANSAAKTDLTNQIVDMANKFKAQKHQEDVLKSSKDYEVLMNAINFNRTLNPNDPTQSALIDHNNNIINQFFSDPKRASRLQKIMGFDAYDMKAEAKKQADPEYQAFQTALKQTQKLNGANLPGAPTGSLATPPAPAGMNPNAAASQAETSNDASKTMPWAGGLNGAAQKFLQTLPIGRMAPQYLASPEELANAWRVANKVEADPDKKLEFIGNLSRWMSSTEGHMGSILSNMDTEQLKTSMSRFNNIQDNTTKWNLGLLDYKINSDKNAIDAARLELEKNKNDDTKNDNNWKLLNDMQGRQLEVIKGIQEQTKTYEDIIKNPKGDAAQKKYAVTALNKLHADQAQEYSKYHSIQQDYQKFAKEKYGIDFSEPVGTAASSSVDDFNKANGSPASNGGNAAGAGSNVSNPGASSNSTGNTWERPASFPPVPFIGIPH